MFFFDTKKSIRNFYTNFKLSDTKIMKKYTMHQLNDIARDIESTTSVKFGRYARNEDDCKQMIAAIKKEIKKWRKKDPFKNVKLEKKVEKWVTSP